MSIVTSYYQEKTQSILKKYGPGPRVHYHMGVVSPEVCPAPDQMLLQRQLTQAQDDMMKCAATFWQAQTPAQADYRILDVGAGLGGASLWMAMHLQAQVHSLVQFAHHAQMIRSYAALCGLSSRVTPVQGDAHTYTPEDGRKYDAIMAMESPCYFDRPAWFAHLDRLLAPGGQIWLEDALLGPTPPKRAKAIFDAYWKTDVGSIREYIEAAESAGFQGRCLDITAQTSEFWRLSAVWIEREMAQARDEAQRKRLEYSLASALFHYDYWQQGFYQVALFSFQRASETSETSRTRGDGR